MLRERFQVNSLRIYLAHTFLGARNAEDAQSVESVSLQMTETNGDQGRHAGTCGARLFRQKVGGARQRAATLPVAVVE